ncbi:MAG: RagB/SusD family nutrient uptake outer membrane protein, partial [Allomuricauda sp.]
FGEDSRLSHEELVARFKENFKKETFHRLLRFLLTRQVHLGESNHTNDLTNQSFYVAMQSFYKDKISAIEENYADVILKYAEALNENGQTAEAIVQLDAIRARAGLAGTTATTQADVRNAIKQERRFEFIGEGHRWLDLKRYGNAVEVMNAFFSSTGANVTIDATKLILPIPQSQLDTDASITQNPGY